MKRALFICTYGGFITSFETNNIKILQKQGYEVHIAANFKEKSKNKKPELLEHLNVVQHNIEFKRNPLTFNNIKGAFILNRLIKKYQFDEIDCHNPVCGVLGRICGRFNHVSHIIYTAHGFHFYKGAPLKNWLLYYPVEWLCSWWTDVLITINNEDYSCAKKHFHMKKLEKIPGVGLDIDRFANCHIDRKEKCKELGIPADKFIMLSVGELNVNKNHGIVIDALNRLENGNIVYLIAGQGTLMNAYKDKIMYLNLEKQVKLLGYRSDVDELYQMADCYIHPSLREGLGMAPLEAMASGLPVICSQIRGNVDLIENGKGGYLFQRDSVEDIKEAINKTLNDKGFRVRAEKINKENVKSYGIDECNMIMEQIYRCLDK